MKDIFAFVGKILGLVFAALVIGFTAWLTWLLAQRIIPDNTALQAMTVVLFDGGALIWFTLFLTQAKGTAQWAVAGLGFAMGLLGAVIMAGGELILGQSLVKLEDTTQLGWILVSTTIAAALVHATLTYAFHFLDPEVRNRIENNQKVSKVVEDAYKDARAEIERTSQALGQEIAQSMYYEAKAQLSAAALPHLRRGAEYETMQAEGKNALIIPAGEPRQTAPARASLFTLPTPPKKIAEVDALKAELAILRAELAAQNLNKYAAETTSPPAVRPLEKQSAEVIK